MVLLVVILALMAIAMTVAVQLVSFTMQREREAELIFRGQQYVEAIRLYKIRYGRHPMTLKEIWEADPKVIRKAYKDPITDSLNWGLVFLGQEGRTIRPATGGLATPTPAPTATPTPAPTRGPFDPNHPAQIGPIMGVHSRSCETSIKVFEGRSRYCDWKFMLRPEPGQRGGVTRPGNPPPGGGPQGGGNPPGGGKG
jgi:type II secretory pathway pseudopilin PulG